MTDEDAKGLMGCIAVPAVLAFVIYAVWSPAATDAVTHGAARDQKIVNAQDRVRNELRDPRSAEFTHTNLHGVSTVCGRVNSRTGFGGMSGPQRFVVTKASVFLEEQQEAVIPGHFAGFWQQMCG